MSPSQPLGAFGAHLGGAHSPSFRALWLFWTCTFAQEQHHYLVTLLDSTNLGCLSIEQTSRRPLLERLLERNYRREDYLTTLRHGRCLSR